MGSTTVHGDLIFGTQGVDKIRSADAAVDKLTNRTGALASMHGIGGEKMAKYATSAALLSGNMTNLGIGGEAVSRGFGLATEAMTGMLGPIGLITVGIGALGTIVGVAIQKQREWKKEVAESKQTILDTIAQTGIGNLLESSVAREAEKDLIARQRRLQREIDAYAAVARKPEQNVANLGRRSSDSLLIAGAAPGSLTGLGPMTEAEIEKLRQKAIVAYPELRKVNDELYKLWVASEGGTPPSGFERPGAKKAGGFRPQVFPWDIAGPPSMASGPGGENYRFGAASFKDPQVDAAKQVETAWVTANENILGSFEHLSTAGKAIYAGMSAGIEGLSAGTSKIVQAFLLKENVSRLKGVEIVKYTAAVGGAAIIRTIGDVAKQRAIEATAQGFLALGWLPGPAGAAASFKAAGLYGLLAGAAYGVAGAMQTGAEKDLQRGLSGGSGTATGSSGSDVYGTASATGPGTQMATAAAAPQTLNYYFTVTYQGSVIYGSGGTRDWFYRELLPIMREYDINRGMGQVDDAS